MSIDPTYFDIEIIERTQKLIKNYRGKSNFTLLINCLYSLIILTTDKIRDQNILYFQTNVQDVPELTVVINKPGFIFHPVGNNGNANNKSLENFILRMRHSLAHPTIEPENALGVDEKLKWRSITFTCKHKYAPNNPTELRASFTSKELKDFAINISTLYQRHVLGV
jgi:HEPN family protein